MIRFGIYELAQLQNNPNPKTILGDPEYISMSLYDEISDLPDFEATAEQILLLASDEHGVYKRSYKRRFDEFDQQVIRIICENVHCPNDMTIHDIGVSDARTSVSFFENLQIHFPTLVYYASDSSFEVLVIEDGPIRLTTSSNKRPIEIVCPPFAVNIAASDSYRRYPINYFLKLIMRRWLAPRILARYHAGLLRTRLIRLVCPEARSVSETNPEFRLISHDIFDPSPMKKAVMVVRVMNLLNPSYFNGTQIEEILCRVFDSLAIDGVFVTGSNQDIDSAVDGAIYQKAEKGFVNLWQSGTGSPISSQIEAFLPERSDRN